MGNFSKHIENKQISINDIVRLANMFEDYKKEWIAKAKEEEKFTNSIENRREYYDLKSVVEYHIDFKDGRLENEKSNEWFENNLDNLELISKIEINFNLRFFDYKNVTEKDEYVYRNFTLYIRLNLANRKVFDVPLINVETESKNLNLESNVMFKQITNLKNEYDGKNELKKEDILKFEILAESFKKEWLERFEKENEYINSLPSKKKQYSGMSISIRYEIDLSNGKNKTEENYDWFIENLKNVKKITYIAINFYLSYIDEKADLYKNISSSVQFFSKGILNSSTKIEISSTNLEKEAENLYNKIFNVFKDNDVRYDKTIKNRTIRMETFPIAVGVILSYIVYIVLKILLKDSDDNFVKLLNNKNFIIFGQWFIAIVGGNIISSWYIKQLYSPLLPNRIYIGFDSSKGHSVYRDDIDEYVADSELQFGDFYDLKHRRNLIEKLFKYSYTIIFIQIAISILVYIIIK